MIKKINFQLLNKSGLEVDIDCRYLETNDKLPAVIFSHGFKGFKDWGGFPYMMQKFAEAGFFAISFNFSCNGVSKESPMEFTHLDLFAENTYSKELDDLKIVTDYFFENADKFSIDKNKIAYIGHSRGGGAAIISAAYDKRIKSLVTLASVSSYNRFGKEQLRMWKEKKYFESENTRTKQMMRMNLTILEDLEKNKEKLDILNAVTKLDIPFLIIHGKEDLSVRYSEAEEIYSKSDQIKTELLLINNTGHTFGVIHPFNGTTAAFENVIENSINFLKETIA